MKFSYRKHQGQMVDEGRVRFHVDAIMGNGPSVYIGTVEGHGLNWTLNTKDSRHFKSRKDASEELAFWYHRQGRDWMYVLAIVKGLVEHEDASSYFGSTCGLYDHTQDAIKRGMLIYRDDYQDDLLHLTDKARNLYQILGLEKLPQQKFSRAYSWDWDHTLGWNWIKKLPKDGE